MGVIQGQRYGKSAQVAKKSGIPAKKGTNPKEGYMTRHVPAMGINTLQAWKLFSFFEKLAFSLPCFFSLFFPKKGSIYLFFSLFALYLEKNSNLAHN